MSDLARSSSPSTRSGPPPPGTSDLLDDYRRRREALREEARQLAHLQAEVLGAAERDASAILADARTAIGHIISEARRDLQDLSKRVEVIASVEEEERGFRSSTASVDAAATRASLERARRDLAQLLDDAKPEIESLQWEASRLGGAAHELAPVRPPGWRPAPDAPDVRPMTPSVEALPPQQAVDVPAVQQPVEARP